MGCLSVDPGKRARGRAATTTRRQEPRAVYRKNTKLYKKRQQSERQASASKKQKDECVWQLCDNGSQALQLRSPRVPFEIAALTLPAAADPRFKVHFAAVERWSRKICAAACSDGSCFQGTRKVPADVLQPKELVNLWWKIHNTEEEELINRWVHWCKQPNMSASCGGARAYGTWSRLEPLSCRRAHRPCSNASCCKTGAGGTMRAP